MGTLSRPQESRLDTAEPAPGPSVLLNPGPVLVDERVRAALTHPDVCHREPEVTGLLHATRRKVTALAGGGDGHASVVLTGSGTAALEAAIASVVPPTGKLLVLDNGTYGTRLGDIAEANGVPHERAIRPWHEPLDAAALDRRLAADATITHVAAVHHETSSGMLNPVAELGAVTRRHGRELIVDAISSLGSEPLDVARDGVDWCVGTANKCLEGLPGVSFVTGTRDGFAALAGVPRRSLYLDLHGHFAAQERGAPLFTPAVQVLYAFDQALALALAEGVDARHRRHGGLNRRLRAALADRGCTPVLPEAVNASTVTVAELPPGVAYPALHDAVKAAGYTIYAAPLDGVFRVATMGQLTEPHIDGFLAAFDAAVARLAPAVVPA
ncbi:MAG TPA: aminotransferase class V-fold PLP-dependent enzyme [Solirubrobacteraceae bacterium]|nr:aminotransferase class V-fold PLP-dependent enzyme [Solirubrobacteraceae bacterium]